MFSKVYFLNNPKSEIFDLSFNFSGKTSFLERAQLKVEISFLSLLSLKRVKIKGIIGTESKKETLHKNRVSIG